MKSSVQGRRKTDGKYQQEKQLLQQSDLKMALFPVNK